MKKVILLTLLCLGYAIKVQKSREDESIYTSVETAPVFNGGYKALYSYVCENINIPKDIPTDKVFIKFVVEKDGSVSSPEIIKGLSANYNKEAIRVIFIIKMASRWNH